MRTIAAALGAWLVVLSGHAGAQQPCGQALLEIPRSTRPIAFTEAQEADLGDAIAEHLHHTFPPVDEQLNVPLQRLGERVLAQLPPSKLAYRFMLVNHPHANAFALPGGRIYVTRKMVALARTEDELAGVLAHEIGHVATRQIGADMTALFRRVLGVREFGDRRDVFDKYRQLVDSPEAAPGRSARHDAQNQYDADAVALAAVARAGYSPDAYVELWDRFTETDRRTGNFFSDLFGVTRPESRRLRQMLRAMAAVPAECRTPEPANSGDFDAWRLRVIEGGDASPTATLRAVVDERALDPPLRDDVTHLKFSPDGRFVLAQDAAGISVLTREPFAVRFRIDAEGALPAHFTPDSAHVVFHTDDLRIERWEVDTGVRAAVRELVVREPCLQTALSPDGRVAACVDLARMLLLIDVETQAVIFKKDRTHALTLGGASIVPVVGPDGLPSRPFGFFRLAFSPGGRYFVAATFASTLAIDVQRREQVDLGGSLGRALRGSFAFVGDDRVASVDRSRPEDSAILRFPTGERLQTITLGGEVDAATGGDHLILRPIQGWAVGVVDVRSGRIVLANKTSAFDVHQGTYVSERLNGELGLYGLDSPRPIATASMPKAPLAGLRVAFASGDLKWLALSARERGGVWRLDTGARVAHVLGFTGAFVDDDALYADYPEGTRFKDGKPVEHARAIVRLDLQRHVTQEHAAVGDDFTLVIGPYMVVATPDKPDQWDRNVTLAIHDVPTRRLLWSRRFARQPPARWHVDAANRRMILQWPLSSPEARRELKDEPRLREAISERRLAGGDAFLDVVSLDDGRGIGRLAVHTGSDEWKITRITSSGDAVVVADRNNQLAVYSIASGARRGSTFGRYGLPSAAASLLCVENEPGKLEFLDLATLEPRDVVDTGSALLLAQFSRDGSRLVVVTADQMVRTIDVAALGTR